MLHNTFTLSFGSRPPLTVQNQVLIPAAVALREGMRYAKFIRVHTAGSAKSYLAQLSSINSNPARGRLAASYSAVLDKLELAGEEITALSLSPDGVADVNLAPLANPYPKSGSEELCVTASVYLDSEFLATVPVCGDRNPLIRALLGAEDFSHSEVFAHFGACAVPEHSDVTDTTGKTENKIPASCVSSGSGVAIACELPPGARDAVLFVADKPALRVSMDPFLSESLLIQKNASAERVVSAGTGIVLRSVGTVAQGQDQLTGAQIVHIPKRLVKAEGDIMVHFGREQKILTDPSSQRAAFVSGSELHLIGSKHGKLCALAALDRRGAEPHLVDGGEMVLVFSDRAQIYKFTENSGVEKVCEAEFSAPGTGKSAVAKCAGRYVLARQVLGGQIECGYIYGGAYTLCGSVAACGDEAFFRNRNTVGVVSVSSASAHFWDHMAENYVAGGNVSAFLSSYGPGLAVGETRDGLIHLYKPDTPAFNCVFSIAGNYALLVASGASVALCGDYAVVTPPVGQKQIFYYNRDTVQLVPVTISEPSSVAELAEVAGMLLVRREDGRLEEWAIEPDRSLVYHPLLVPGVSTLVPAAGVAAGAAAGARRVTVTIQ